MAITQANWRRKTSLGKQKIPRLVWTLRKRRWKKKKKKQKGEKEESKRQER